MVSAARTLNGAKLDLFGLYRSVANRSGERALLARDMHRLEDVFPDLNNYTENHRATSAGHDLIGHYQNFRRCTRRRTRTTSRRDTRRSTIRAELRRRRASRGRRGRGRRGRRRRGVGPSDPHDVARDDRPGAVAVAVAPEAVLAAPAASPRAFSPRASRESVALERFHWAGCKVKVFLPP